MDSVTHVLLGGAIGQALGKHRVGGWGFWIGALAATVPDFDVFIHTGDAMWNHALHRHFMHALVMVPVLAAITAAGFLFMKRLRREWQTVGLVALLACLSHTLLDSLTSYGTMMFWPFSDERVALDVIAVVDLLFTGVLLAGVVGAWRWRRRWPAAAGMGLALLYIGWAFVQHGRAMGAQQLLLAARGVDLRAVEDARVLPQIGTVVNYRSLYRVGDEIRADAIRVPWWGEASVKAGVVARRVHFADLHAVGGMAWDFGLYDHFADGYVVRDPREPLWLDDLRYTSTIDGEQSIWALQLEHTERPLWHSRFASRALGGIWRELVDPQHYVPISELPKQP